MNAVPQTVLVVDDDAALRAFMELLLGAEGYTVRTAATLGELDRELNRGRPDVVVADVHLPGIAPFAVLDHLDAEPATRELPVLLCSGAVHELRAGSERLRRPRTEALTKPFDIDDMLACIARLAAGDASDRERAPTCTDLA